MRSIRKLLLLAMLLPLMALAAADNLPDLEPVPEPPPPPAGYDMEAGIEPEIKIIKRGAETVEEYRINGELYMMKVTPEHGVPYYMMKEDRDGPWARMDGPAEHMSIPKWVLFNF